MQVQTTGCLMLRGGSGGRSPSGIWACTSLGSRQHCAGARTPTTTSTSSSQAATGGSAPRTTESSLPRAACRTGSASPASWTPLSETSTVRARVSEIKLHLERYM